MAEQQIVNTLRSKRDELVRIISSYETATTAAKRDLVHVNATLELFEREGAAGAYPSRMSIVRMFKRGEIFSLCKTALCKLKMVLIHVSWRCVRSVPNTWLKRSRRAQGYWL